MHAVAQLIERLRLHAFLKMITLITRVSFAVPSVRSSVVCVTPARSRGLTMSPANNDKDFEKSSRPRSWCLCYVVAWLRGLRCDCVMFTIITLLYAWQGSLAGFSNIVGWRCRSRGSALILLMYVSLQRCRRTRLHSRETRLLRCKRDAVRVGMS